LNLEIAVNWKNGNTVTVQTQADQAC